MIPTSNNDSFVGLLLARQASCADSRGCPPAEAAAKYEQEALNIRQQTSAARGLNLRDAVMKQKPPSQKAMEPGLPEQEFSAAFDAETLEVPRNRMKPIHPRVDNIYSCMRCIPLHDASPRWRPSSM